MELKINNLMRKIIIILFISIIVSTSIFSQNRNITGKVTTEDNKSLHSFIYTNTDQYVLVDNLGRFSIDSLSSRDSVLIISVIGYHSKSILIKNTNYVEIKLSIDTVNLKKRISDIQFELISLANEDQKIRKKIETIDKNNLLDKLIPFYKQDYKDDITLAGDIDMNNIKRISYIIERNGWVDQSVFGVRASECALLIIIHSYLSYQKKYLPLLENAVLTDDASKPLLALLVDKILVAEGKKQLYGTQFKGQFINSSNGYSTKKSEMQLHPIDDEVNIDVRRAKMGLGFLKDYIEAFKKN